jgi:hypothetical protein
MPAFSAEPTATTRRNAVGQLVHAGEALDHDHARLKRLRASPPEVTAMVRDAALWFHR